VLATHKTGYNLNYHESSNTTTRTLIIHWSILHFTYELISDHCLYHKRSTGRKRQGERMNDYDDDVDKKEKMMM
jgi:hypothetical protein